MALHLPEEKIVTLEGIKLVKDLNDSDKVLSLDGFTKIKNIDKYNDDYFHLNTVNNQIINVKKDGDIYLERTTLRKTKKKSIHSPQRSISILEYINSNKNFKHIYKTKLHKIIDFNIENKTKTDPYLLGLLIGDGSLGASIGITTTDNEVVEEIYRQAKKYNLSIRVNNSNNTRCSTYFFSSGRSNKNKNELIKEIKELGLHKKNSGTKFIPDNYKLSERSMRLSLLAGIIDSDGSYIDNCIDFISKSKKLSEDVCFLSRSLGLRATMKETIKTCYNNGKKGFYYRVFISGETSIIPTKIDRKKFNKRLQKKDPSRFGFKVKEVSDGSFINIDTEEPYLNYEFMVCV